MARTKQFALEKGGPKRLELSWRGIWKDVTVKLDGVEVGEPLPDFKALKAGREYKLPDGRALFVQFENKLGGGGLAVTLDGRPLPGAGNDPREAIKIASITLWVVAGLNLVLGFVLLGIAGGRAEAGEYALVIGIPTVFAVLGWLVWKYRSRAALLIAIIIEVVDSVYTIAVMSEGGRVPTAGIFLRVVIIMALIRGYKAVSDAKALERSELVDTFK